MRATIQGTAVAGLSYEGWELGSREGREERDKREPKIHASPAVFHFSHGSLSHQRDFFVFAVGGAASGSPGQ